MSHKGWEGVYGSFHTGSLMPVLRCETLVLSERWTSNLRDKLQSQIELYHLTKHRVLMLCEIHNYSYKNHIGTKTPNVSILLRYYKGYQLSSAHNELEK